MEKKYLYFLEKKIKIKVKNGEQIFVLKNLFETLLKYVYIIYNISGEGRKTTTNRITCHFFSAKKTILLQTHYPVIEATFTKNVV